MKNTLSLLLGLVVFNIPTALRCNKTKDYLTHLRFKKNLMPFDQSCIVLYNKENT